MISEIDIADMSEDLVWTDEWDCKHKMSKSAATTFLQQFFNEWPGGMEEIDSCVNHWVKVATESCMYNKQLLAESKKVLDLYAPLDTPE